MTTPPNQEKSMPPPPPPPPVSSGDCCSVEEVGDSESIVEMRDIDGRRLTCGFKNK